MAWTRWVPYVLRADTVLAPIGGVTGAAAAASLAPRFFRSIKYGANQIKWKMTTTRKTGGIKYKSAKLLGAARTNMKRKAAARRGGGAAGRSRPGAKGRAARRTVRRRVGSSVDPGLNYAIRKSNGGYRKAVSGPSGAWRFIKSQLESTVFRYNGVNSFSSDAGGYYPLHNYFDSTAQVRYMPVHVFDINFEQSSDVNTSHSCHYSLRFRNIVNGTDTGEKYPTFINLAGSGSGGTNNALQRWNWESGIDPGNDISQVRGSGDMLEWFQAKLMLYGTTLQPTRYRVILAKLTGHGPWHPAENVDVWSVVDNETEATRTLLADAAIPWTKLAHPLTHNPIHTYHARGNHHNMRFKIIKEWNEIIEPRESTNGDASPNFRQLEIFERVNQVCRYDHVENVPTQSTMQQDDAIPVQTANTIAADNVKPYQRHYLIICAQSGYRAGAGGPGADVTLTPTYDLQVRKKITFMGSG